jgi:hypothetical protein
LGRMGKQIRPSCWEIEIYQVIIEKMPTRM